MSSICWLHERNNAQINDAEGIDIVMLMYNLIEYSDTYSKTWRSLWQCYRDEPALDSINNIIDFHASCNSAKNKRANMKQWHKRCSNNDTLIFSKRKYFLLTLEIKEYNVLIDGRNFFDKPLKNYL